MNTALPIHLRQTLYFGAHRLIGMDIGAEYRRMLREDRSGQEKEITRGLLVELLDHSMRCVPYYREHMAQAGGSFRDDPEGYLARLPLLTKADIRKHFEELKSEDLQNRKWRTNTTGGSTGKPAVFIQDQAYYARVGALQWLSHDWAGRRFGEPGIRVWGSVDDILKNTAGAKMNAINYLTNDVWFNAFRLSPDKMRSLVDQINAAPPKLIIAYVQSIFELAKFAEREGIRVKPQAAVLTSAGPLHPFMREQIERVFHCPVYNRYGSREVGDIACECEQHQGLHVFPWGCYVEIVDDEGRRVPPGVEGNIVLTSLANHAMPLIRYVVEDRGVLSPRQTCACGRSGQILEKVSGRLSDVFETRGGTLVDGAYFSFQLHFLPWVEKFQVVQKEPDWVVYRFVRSQAHETPEELEEIARKARLAMGEDCRVDFEFVDDIAPSPSGKYRYIYSEVRQHNQMEDRR